MKVDEKGDALDFVVAAPRFPRLERVGDVLLNVFFLGLLAMLVLGTLFSAADDAAGGGGSHPYGHVSGHDHDHGREHRRLPRRGR